LRFASLRASLRRKERDPFFLLPSTYEPARAQEPRPRWLDVLGYSQYGSLKALWNLYG
jgi:hypothetical protein